MIILNKFINENDNFANKTGRCLLLNKQTNKKMITLFYFFMLNFLFNFDFVIDTNFEVKKGKK